MTLRQSFKDWRLPKELDGVLLVEDRWNGSGSMATQELHSHDELELHFLERGKATFSFPSSQLVAEAGTLVWVPPGREHLLESASSDLVRWVLLCRRRVVLRVLPQGAGGALLTRSAKELSSETQQSGATAASPHTPANRSQPLRVAGSVGMHPRGVQICYKTASGGQWRIARLRGPYGATKTSHT